MRECVFFSWRTPRTFTFEMGCLFARGRGQWSKLGSDTKKTPKKQKPKTGAFVEVEIKGKTNKKPQSKFSKSLRGNSKFPLSIFQSWYLNASWSSCSCVGVQITSRVVLPRDGWRIKMLIKRFHSRLIQWHPRLLLVTAGTVSKHYMSQNSLGENTNWENRTGCWCVYLQSNQSNSDRKIWGMMTVMESGSTWTVLTFYSKKKYRITSKMCIKYKK